MPSTTEQISSQPFHTWEMIEHLRDKLDVPEELGEAFLGVWVWAIRYAVLSLLKEDDLSVDQLRKGEGKILLTAGLAPPGWRDEDLRAQLTLQTGLPDDAGRQLLEEVSTKLAGIGGVPFEPLGCFSARVDGKPGFTLRFHPDFLEPLLDGPPHLGEEVEMSGAAGSRIGPSRTLVAMRRVPGN